MKNPLNTPMQTKFNVPNLISMKFSRKIALNTR